MSDQTDVEQLQARREAHRASGPSRAGTRADVQQLSAQIEELVALFKDLKAAVEELKALKGEKQ